MGKKMKFIVRFKFEFKRKNLDCLIRLLKIFATLIIVFISN